MKNNMLRIGALSAGLLVSASSYANCGQIVAIFGYQASLISFPDCVAVVGGTSPSSAQTLSATQGQQVLAISNAVGNRTQRANTPNMKAVSDLHQTTGLAAGGVAPEWNAWVNVGNTNSQFNTSNAAETSVDSRITSWVLGVDKQMSPTSVLGVSAAFDRANNDSTMIGAATVNNMVDGYTIAPYFSMQFSKGLALDAAIGFGRGDLSADGGLTSNKSDRFFAAANLNYTQWMDNIQLTGKGGFIHSSEKFGDAVSSAGVIAGSANRQTLDQLQASIRAGYWMEGGIMPYAEVGFTHDTTNTGASSTVAISGVEAYGKTAYPLTLGVDFISLKSNLTGGISYRDELGRSRVNNRTLSANLSYRF